MNAAEHYREAERLLDVDVRRGPFDAVARAQVHATLANSGHGPSMREVPFPPQDGDTP